MICTIPIQLDITCPMEVNEVLKARFLVSLMRSEDLPRPLKLVDLRPNLGSTSIVITRVELVRYHSVWLVAFDCSNNNLS